MKRSKLRIIPLGGLGEIGKNMMALEYGDDIIAIDAGLMFPEEDMLGVDLVIPDISYLEENRDRVRAILITHGHEDHIGALPFILPRLNVPVFSTRLTHGLISVKLKEARVHEHVKLNVVDPDDKIVLGSFEVEFFRVSHSIPDAVGLIIHTPLGTIVHSGDFKVDYTPVDDRRTDFVKLAQVSSSGVFLLFSDSTYVERPGYTASEMVVGESLNRIIGDASGRVIVATFASLISRMQQVINAASQHGRRVFAVGRSMVDNLQMALELGYIYAPEGILGHIEELRHMKPKEVVILTTGAQGEPTSALVRMANRDHRHIRIAHGDTVVISASPIPGNESLVHRTIDNLFKQGAKVLYPPLATVHVHGHGSQEELKLLLSMVRPRFFVPIHGEHRHLLLHTHLAQSVGVPEEHTFVLDDGDVLELDYRGGRVSETLPLSNTYVDGLRVGGDISNVVIRDRRLLSQDGMVVFIVTVDQHTGKVVGEPYVLSRGFVDPTEAGDLLQRTGILVARSVDHGKHLAEIGYVNTKVKDIISKFLYEETHRRPMILPVVLEV